MASWTSFLSLYLLITTAWSLPTIKHASHAHLDPTDQQPLSELRRPLLPAFRKPSASLDGPHFDPAPNTVGVYFEHTKSSGVSESVQIWMPLGKPVQVRDHPFIPAHPTMARLMGVVMDGTKDQHLDTTACTIRPDNSNKYWRDKREPVTFRASDGLVDLENLHEPWFLDHTQVESYECS